MLADPKLVSVLNTVNGDFVKYIQDIVNGSEKLEDIQNQVKEQLTQVSFDSVFDNFVDTLMDMDSSAKDFANNFERYMQKAMLTTMLGNKYKAELQNGMMLLLLLTIIKQVFLRKIIKSCRSNGTTLLPTRLKSGIN